MQNIKNYNTTMFEELEEDEEYIDDEEDEEYIDEDEEDNGDDLIIQDMADFLKIFGDYSRIKILKAIMNQDCAVCDIADYTGLTETAVSHHLKILRRAKLVVGVRDGRYVYYHIVDKHVREIYNITRTHIEEFQKTISEKDEADEMAEILYEELYSKK